MIILDWVIHILSKLTCDIVSNIMRRILKSINVYWNESDKLLLSSQWYIAINKKTDLFIYKEMYNFDRSCVERAVNPLSEVLDFTKQTLYRKSLYYLCRYFRIILHRLHGDKWNSSLSRMKFRIQHVCTAYVQITRKYATKLRLDISCVT